MLPEPSTSTTPTSTTSTSTTSTSTTQVLKRLPLRINVSLFLSYLPGFFMLLVLLLGIIFILLSPSTYQWPGGSFFKGEATARYEQQFNEHLPFKEGFISTWGILDYLLFKQGREGVLAGREGWFFTTEEFTYYPDEAAALADKLAYIVEVRDTLAAQGIELVVTLVPAKARVYPEYLGRFSLPDYAYTRYDRELAVLKTAGVQAIDLRPALLGAKSEGQVFFKTDTHWTPLGAKAAAQALAQELQVMGFDLPFGESSFSTKEEGQTELEGDLMKFLPLGLLSEQLSPEKETLVTLSTAQTNLGLFADNSRPVTLVGTSYSADERWNFVGALKESLGINVLNAAMVGRGEIKPMQDYLASDNPLVNKPKLLIWQLSERGFPMSIDEESK